MFVAAIFWSSLWGPAGLILSTPLSLCLVVAGRHLKALGILELLLSDAQPLALPQIFYQRALSGDPEEIIANARPFLKSDFLAAYCDRVLIPALHLAQLDAAMAATTGNLQTNIRRVIVKVVAALSSYSLRLPRRAHRSSVVKDLSAGGWLSQKREPLSGRWQGPMTSNRLKGMRNSSSESCRNAIACRIRRLREEKEFQRRLNGQ